MPALLIGAMLFSSAAILPAEIASASEEQGEGRIDVRSMTSGVRVSIDGIEVARLPLQEPLTVTPGSYEVTLFAPGYMAHVENVTVDAGRQVVVEADLFAFAGVLFLNSNVDGALVRVGQLELGRTPMVEREIVAGEHEIIVEAEGYLAARESLRVFAGVRYELDVTLVADPEAMAVAAEESTPTKPSLLGRWWIWAAAGAVLAGGGVAIAAANGRSVEIYDPSRLPGGTPDAIINPPR